MKPKLVKLPALAVKQNSSLAKPDSATGKMHGLGFDYYKLSGSKARRFWVRDGECFEISNAESVHEFADSLNQ